MLDFASNWKKNQQQQQKRSKSLTLCVWNSFGEFNEKTKLCDRIDNVTKCVQFKLNVKTHEKIRRNVWMLLEFQYRSWSRFQSKSRNEIEKVFGCAWNTLPPLTMFILYRLCFYSAAHIKTLFFRNFFFSFLFPFFSSTFSALIFCWSTLWLDTFKRYHNITSACIHNHGGLYPFMGFHFFDGEK